MNRNFLKVVLFAGLIIGLTGCERPANISPIGPVAPTAPAAAAAAATTVPAEPKAVTPTLLIKTPVKVATQASGFQEILSATQTAVATIRSGTLTATAMGLSGTQIGTPGTPGTPMAGTGTPGITSTPMALGTIYPATPTAEGTMGAMLGTLSPNSTPGAMTGTLVIPTATKFIANFPIIPGVPTFGIQSVVGDGTVTVVTSEFPANSKFTVYMGSAGTRGYGGTLLGTFDTEKGGQKTLVFNIPATLYGYSPIDMRIEFPDGRYTYNFFYNITAN